MRTTAIVIEHLVIGIQTALWVAFLFLAWYGYDWIPVLTLPSHVFFILLSILVLYPLGVFVDEFSDWLFHNLSMRIRREHVTDGTLTTFQLLVRLNDPSTSQYFQYLRSRIRLARSSSVNFLLLTVAVIFFTVRQYSPTPDQPMASLVIIEGITGIIITLLALFSWWRVSHTFAKRIKWGWEAFHASIETKSKGSGKKQRNSSP